MLNKSGVSAEAAASTTAPGRSEYHLQLVTRIQAFNADRIRLQVEESRLSVMMSRQRMRTLQVCGVAGGHIGKRAMVIDILGLVRVLYNRSFEP